MSAIYDNWERLVDAVVKKQQLWELFHDSSRSPSILSRASSDLSSSSFISSYRLDDHLASDFASHWSSSSTYRRNPKLVDVSKISSIKDLQVAAAKMEDKRVSLQNKVDAAKRNGELIWPPLETWLRTAEETQRTAKQIIEAQIPAGIFSLKRRYSLSRKAMKKTKILIKLQHACNFNFLSTPRRFDPPAPSKGTMIDSRKETEEDIIMAIKDVGVSVIGLWGMGGVGKTTMAKRIMARAGEEGLFDEFSFATVSQQPDMLRIQREIADWLGLELNQEALEPRANRLWARAARLMDAKRKLIVIDDVRETIDLESLGIPLCSGSCTVLLTSRDKGVLHRMSAQKVYTVDTLSEGEAWLMFKENAGACVEDSNLLPIASDVAKECKGLPLALVTVARLIKGNESKGIWLHALKQLRSSKPVDIEDVISKVCNPIKLSIDFLDSPQAKSLLFLCSSFPEDYDISLEELVLYSFGLCMFDDINNLEGARNRIATLISTLKSRSLILDGRNEDYVKMHDVVRDVVIFIAAEEKHAIVEFRSIDWSRENLYSDCTMLSVVVAKEQRIDLLPMELGATFPNLRFLSMPNAIFHSMSVNCLKGMQKLKVLHISYFSFGSTLQSMVQLKNLHTLHLEYCHDLETLSPVSELSSLEILCCYRCNLITELPVEIGRLNRLRLLELSDCYNLKTIMPGVISRLGRLEELKMLGSFKGWESVEEGSNVSLVELESLSNLRCLEIEIEDWRLAGQELQLLSSKIVKYDIRVGKRSRMESTNYEKKLSLVFPKVETSIGKWIDVFARSADYLNLWGDAYNTENLNWKSGLIVEGIEVRPKEPVQIYSLDPERTFMLPARELQIAWVDNPSYWGWTSLPESRFAEVAELLSVCWLDIRATLRPQILTPNTNYAAYLVFKLSEDHYGLQGPSVASVTFRTPPTEGETTITTTVYLTDPGEFFVGSSRLDGWLEVELGEFYVEEGDECAVRVQLCETENLNWKKGLIVEGIEIGSYVGRESFSLPTFMEFDKRIEESLF